jgi:hypothetical protein
MWILQLPLPPPPPALCFFLLLLCRSSLAGQTLVPLAVALSTSRQIPPRDHRVASVGRSIYMPLELVLCATKGRGSDIDYRLIDIDIAYGRGRVLVFVRPSAPYQLSRWRWRSGRIGFPDSAPARRTPQDALEPSALLPLSVGQSRRGPRPHAKSDRWNRALTYSPSWVPAPNRRIVAARFRVANTTGATKDLHVHSNRDGELSDAVRYQTRRR